MPARANHMPLKLLASLAVGLAPGAPGTYGSLLTVAAAGVWLHFGGAPLAGWGYIVFLALLTLLAVWVSQTALDRQAFGPDHDPGSIVIDEAAGQLIALYGIQSFSLWELAAALAAFRLFDILKPWPVNVSQKLPGGWGVTVDDVLAGGYALAVMTLLRCIGPNLWGA